MCDQSFLEPPAAPLPGSTAEIPDIFDVLAGGEDEGTVRCLSSAINPQSHMCRYLLGYQEGGGLMGCVEGFTNMEGGEEQLALPLTTNYPTALPPNTSTETSAAPRSPVVVRPAQPSDAGALAAANKKRDTSGSKVDQLFNSRPDIPQNIQVYHEFLKPSIVHGYLETKFRMIS